MSLSLTAFATNLISDLGYGGLTIGMVLDSFGVPIPSEVLIPLTVVAGTQRFNLVLVLLLSVVAQVAGGLVSFWVGRVGGLPFVERYGRYLLIVPADVERAQRSFSRHGHWFVGLGRCVPIVRGFVGYPAGMSKMSAWAFVAWTALGAACWSAALIGMGEIWRRNISVINHAIDKASIAVVVLLVIGAALHIRRALRRSPPAGAKTDPGESP